MTQGLAGAVPGHLHHLLLALVDPGLGGHGEDDGLIAGPGLHGPRDPDGLYTLAAVSLSPSTPGEILGLARRGSQLSQLSYKLSQLYMFY